MPYADNSYPNANEIESETLLVWQRFEGPKVQTMGKACIKAYLNDSSHSRPIMVQKAYRHRYYWATLKNTLFEP